MTSSINTYQENKQQLSQEHLDKILKALNNHFKATTQNLLLRVVSFMYHGWWTSYAKSLASAEISDRVE